MADTTLLVAGAYYACVAIFALCGLGFTVLTKERVYLFFTLHAVAIGGLALTFPPVAPAANAVEHWHMSCRMAAEGIVLATAGLLASHLVAQSVPHWLRIALLFVCPFGLLFAGNAWWFPAHDQGTAIYGAAMLLALVILFAGITTAAIQGSQQGRFLALAFFPLLFVGALAALFEMMLWPSLTFYAEGMLLAFAFELIVVFSNLGMRLRDTMRSHDLALADVQRERLLSHTDPLTGLPNRRAFEAELQNNPSQRFAALAILDCDRFKLINDEYGHHTGDEVLREIGKVLAESDGRAMRIGGEEFCVLLDSNTWPDQLERLRMEVPARLSVVAPSLRFPVTVSIGAVALAPDMQPEIAVMLADEALYLAKASGRNRIEIHCDPVCKQEASQLIQAA